MAGTQTATVLKSCDWSLTIKFLLLFSFLILVNPVNAQAVQCHNLIRHPYQENSQIEIYKSPTGFEVREKKRLFRQKFFFLSHINNGAVYINALLRNNRRHSIELSGRVLFDHMMKHYSSQRIHTIVGHWFKYSDNHKTFISALKLGAPPSDAAMLTWTGKQAARYGYKYASVKLAVHRSRDPNFDSYLVVFSKDPLEKTDEIEQVLTPFNTRSIPIE